MKLTLALPLALLLALPAAAQQQSSEQFQTEARQVAQLDEQDDGLGLAESLLSQGRIDDAEALALRVLKDEPEDYRARFILGKVALLRGQTDQATEIARALVAEQPEVPDYHAFSGTVAMLTGDLDASERFLLRALELGEGNIPDGQMSNYGNTLVLVYHRAEKKDKALDLCVDLMARYDQDGDLYLSCSRLYREKGDFENALQIAQKGLAQIPDFYRLHASVALAHAGLGHPEEAEKAYLLLQAQDPELAKVLRATLDGSVPDDAEYKVRVE